MSIKTTFCGHEKNKCRILWIFLAISVQVIYTIHNKQIKNDFSTRRLNGWYPLTFLRREPIWYIGAFAVKNRFSYRYYILYGNDLSSVAVEFKPPDCRKSGGFFVYILVKPAKKGGFYIVKSENREDKPRSIFEKMVAEGLVQCGLFAVARGKLRIRKTQV